jgi:hypothetical protein
MRRWLVVATVLAACTSLVGGWASASSTSVLGTWKDHLSLNEMYDGGYDPRLAGTFKLVLAKDGTYRTYNSFDGWDRGTFTVSENRIVFAEDKGCIEGGITTKKGFYRWSITAGKLKLTARRGDPCGGRWQTLTYPTWKRS